MRKRAKHEASPCFHSLLLARKVSIIEVMGKNKLEGKKVHSAVERTIDNNHYCGSKKHSDSTFLFFLHYSAAIISVRDLCAIMFLEF